MVAMTTTATAVRPLPLNTIVKVSGVSFRQDVVRTLVEYDEVRVRHDRDNQYDEHACVVQTLDGRHIGFVPKELAARLAVPNPGGVWRARIEELLRNDTWGVRLRIGPLVSREPSDAGLRPQAAGLRHRGDGVVTADSGAVALAPAEITEPDPEPRVTGRVFAKSGRLLGDLIQVEGKRVHVRTVNGAQATYPATVVQIRR